MKIIDNIMALADEYAGRSQLTEQGETLSRKALHTALTELTSTVTEYQQAADKMAMDHKIERDILTHRIKDIEEELVISKSSVIGMENNQTRMHTERREALDKEGKVNNLLDVVRTDRDTLRQQLAKAQALIDALAAQPVREPLSDDVIFEIACGAADEMWPGVGGVGWTKDDAKFYVIFCKKIEYAHGIGGDK